MRRLFISQNKLSEDWSNIKNLINLTHLSMGQTLALSNGKVHALRYMKILSLLGLQKA